MSGFQAFSHYVLNFHAHGMASMARLRLACNYRTWTACSTVSVCATNSRLAGDDECTFAQSFELVVRAMTMTRPFPRACLILNVIFGTMKLVVSRLLRTARRRRKCIERAGYLLFYGNSGVGRWVSCLSERKCFLLIFVYFKTNS